MPHAIAVALLATALALACATGGGDPGPVAAQPRAAEGEALRGTSAGSDASAALETGDPSGAERLDWNGDHHVDREEFRNHFARVFHALDADDDRLLRGDELATISSESVQHADRDADGALDAHEYVSLALVWFVACDRNADDVLGPDENAACAQTPAE